MEGTDDLVTAEGAGLGGFDQLGGPVRAHIVEHLDAAVGLAHHDDGLVDDGIFDEIPRLRNVLLTARPLPGVQPHLLVFQFSELLVEVALDRQVHTISDPERHLRGVEVVPGRIGLGLFGGRVGWSELGCHAEPFVMIVRKSQLMVATTVPTG